MENAASAPPPTKIKSKGAKAAGNSKSAAGSVSKSGTKKGPENRPSEGMRVPRLMIVPRKQTMTIKYPEVKPLPPYWPQYPSSIPKRDLATPRAIALPRPLSPPKLLVKRRKPYVRPPPPPYEYLRVPRKQKTQVELPIEELQGSNTGDVDDDDFHDGYSQPESEESEDDLSNCEECVPCVPAITETETPVKQKTHVCGRPVPQPKIETVYSEIDFSEYKEAYDQVIEQDYGPGAQHQPLPPPTPPKTTEVDSDKPKNRAKKQVVIVEPVKAPTPAPGPSLTVVPNLDGRHFVDAQDIVTPESSTVSTDNFENVDRPGTALPYWISREDWDDRKALVANRHKLLAEMQETKHKKDCTQLFPGRCFNEWDEQYKRQQDEMLGGGRIPDIHKGRLFRQTDEEKRQEDDIERRQLKYKRMWEELDVMTPDQNHPHIPYRQGSTVVLGFPGHGSITGHSSHHEFHNVNPSDINIHNMKIEYYKRMASLYAMAESEKKERERERMMEATRFLLEICPSLLGDNDPPEEDEKKPGQEDPDFEPEVSEPQNPWFVPYDKKSAVKRLGYNSTYQAPLPIKKEDTKGPKSPPLDTFAQILAEPDNEATYFKICPTCRRYVRTSELSSHPQECCPPQQEEHPNKFNYFNGYRTKSYHVNARPITPPPKNASKNQKNRPAYNQPGQSKPQKGQGINATGGASTSTGKKIVLGDAAHPNPQFHGELLQFHSKGYYFAPADLSKRLKYFKSGPTPSKAPYGHLQRK